MTIFLLFWETKYWGYLFTPVCQRVPWHYGIMAEANKGFSWKTETGTKRKLKSTRILTKIGVQKCINFVCPQYKTLMDGYGKRCSNFNSRIIMYVHLNQFTSLGKTPFKVFIRHPVCPSKQNKTHKLWRLANRQTPSLVVTWSSPPNSIPLLTTDTICLSNSIKRMLPLYTACLAFCSFDLLLANYSDWSCLEPEVSVI